MEDPNSKMFKISEITTQKQNLDGDVKAVILYKVYITMENGKHFWKFLLSDESGLIYAFAYEDFVGDIEKMQEKETVIIEKPRVRKSNNNFTTGDHPNGAELILRHADVSLPKIKNYLNYRPLKLSSLEEIDGVLIGTPVDLIGVISRIHWSPDTVEDWDWDGVTKRPPREFELVNNIFPDKASQRLRCAVWGEHYKSIIKTGGIVILKGAKVFKGFEKNKGVNVGNTTELFFLELDDEDEQKAIIPPDQMHFYTMLFGDEIIDFNEHIGDSSDDEIRNTDESDYVETQIPDDWHDSVEWTDSDESVTFVEEETMQMDTQNDDETNMIPHSSKRPRTSGNCQLSQESVKILLENHTGANVRAKRTNGRRCRGMSVKEYLEDNENGQLVITVKKALQFQDSNQHPRGIYEMKAKSRGITLIINNLHFADQPPKRQRKGSFHDERYMTCLFQQMGFEIVIEANISLSEFPGKLDLYKQRLQASNFDAAVVIVMSHGECNLIELIDGNFINLWTDVIYQFTDELCPYLKGKPKLFFFQACQDFPSDSILEERLRLRTNGLQCPGSTGNENSADVQSSIQNNLVQQTHPDSNQGNVNSNKKEIMRDTLVCFPSLPGTKAGRDIYAGSWFILCIAKIFMENAHNTDLLEMMNMVQQEMADNVEVSGEQMKQCCWIQLLFRKKLFFNPGLYSQINNSNV